MRKFLGIIIYRLSLFLGFENGEMSERIMEMVLKTIVVQATGGSNPSLTAICYLSVHHKSYSQIPTIYRR